MIDPIYKEIPEGSIRWIKITGLEIQNIEKIGKYFDLHPLVIEDILNPVQRPKFEDYGDYIFIIMKKTSFEPSIEKIITEQVGFILGSNYVLTFEEIKSDLFDSIIERIKKTKGRIRSMGTDYLTYALIDVLVDNYFLILDFIGTRVEEIEDVLINHPQQETLQQIYDLKREMIEIRKSVWSMRDVINSLQREQSKLISDDLQLYIRDIYDHIFRIADMLETNREVIVGMLDMYLSSVSNKMNDVMKVLTIISTIFIPLSFLAGFYGMNFQFVPEFTNPVAYPSLIIIMIVIACSMIFYFKKKNWI